MADKIELYIRNKINNKVYDLSSIVSNIKWKTDTLLVAGSLELTLTDNNVILVREGDEISFKYNDVGVFYGWVFTHERDESQALIITAYDQLRYFKNKTIMVRENVTASQLFENLCKQYKLKYKVVTPSNTVLVPYMHDNDSLGDIIGRALKETTITEQKYYILRDNFGIVEFINPYSLKTSLFIGDNSLVKNYGFKSTIDDNTYNMVKITYKDTKKSIRQVYNIYADDYSESAARWGILSDVQASNLPLNEGLATQMGRNFLAIRSAPDKTMGLTCIGDLRIRAGVLVLVYLQKLFTVEGMEKPTYYLVKNCIHTFTSGTHVMDIEIYIPKEGMIL